ncbi:class I SAM-dependent methyltransferase [Methylobrevis albus]|uniref:Class I SAM-dependent methyltransferase n=1 Tax=Methylobrevis albus TaxID=2793297 RepID=A0A931I176_9HYPH|nr:class I SAM-dependent methyltransferase [Methylobrevis albus]MBH0237897.1 class I SAM-dependent methyltransferase [Methylobrevis albus]
MSFSVRWLDLRAPADSGARDPALHAAAADWLRAVAAPLAVDLGSGTGATLRAFDPLAPADLRWRLVDADAGLLAEAKARSGPRAETVVADLAADAVLPVAGARLITASALFDLVSVAWIERLADAATAAGAAVYAALSYDGVMHFDPAHPLDAEVTELFNRHQRSDKGFGPALGPDAAATAAAVFAARGYRVVTAPSPWEIAGTTADEAPETAAFREQLLTGIAGAAREINPAAKAAIDNWLAFRLAAPGIIRIGHGDLLALPPG